MCEYKFQIYGYMNYEKYKNHKIVIMFIDI